VEGAIKLKFWVNKLEDDSYSVSQSAVGLGHSLAVLAFSSLNSITHYFIGH